MEDQERRSIARRFAAGCRLADRRRLKLRCLKFCACLNAGVTQLVFHKFEPQLTWGYDWLAGLRQLRSLDTSGDPRGMPPVMPQLPLVELALSLHWRLPPPTHFPDGADLLCVG